MSLSDFARDIIRPESEFVIGKRFTYETKEGIVLSLIRQGGQDALWVLLCDPTERIRPTPPHTFSTNRAMILNQMMLPEPSGHFDRITIQGVELMVAGSQVTPIDNYPLAYMWMQHFIEAGVDLSPIADASFGKLQFCRYELRDRPPLAALKSGGEARLAFRIRERSRLEPLLPSRRFTLNVGEHEMEEPLTFYDEEGEREISYYIDRIIRYNPRESWEKRIEDGTVQKNYREAGMSEAEIERMLAESREHVSELCGEDEELLLIQYEAQDDIQLQFYTTEHLDAKPEYRNSATSVGFIGGGEEGSVHGHYCRTCFLTKAPKGFDQPLEVELVGCYRKIPERVIEV